MSIRGFYKNAVSISHHMIASVVKKGALVVDASCGRGQDTLFLARLVGNEGKVYAFDIQAQAISSTYSLLAENRLLERVVLIKACHSTIDEQLPAHIDACMFNLGYLPGGDHAIRTQAESSLDALQKSLKILNPGGIVSLVFYPGHSGGREELELIKDFLTRLPQNYFEIMSLEFINQVNNPPRLIVVRKIKEGEDETAPAALHN